MRPYYEHAGITIYHGDCREVLPGLCGDTTSLNDTRVRPELVLTDPPYPSYYVEEYRYTPDLIAVLDLISCRQFVFWTPSQPFPLNWQGKRIWDKAVGTNTQFEEIYERNSASGYKVHRHYSMGCFSSVGAQMTDEIVTGHPSQKPLRLFRELIGCTDSETVLDPFMGSGTTLRAAKDLGRRAIGIEIEEKYCEIAAKRLSQEVFEFDGPTRFAPEYKEPLRTKEASQILRSDQPCQRETALDSPAVLPLVADVTELPIVEDGK